MPKFAQLGVFKIGNIPTDLIKGDRIFFFKQSGKLLMKRGAQEITFSGNSEMYFEGVSEINFEMHKNLLKDRAPDLFGVSVEIKEATDDGYVTFLVRD